MFKIKLPNASEMSIQEWFIQMKIVLKSAEKSYEAMEKVKKEAGNEDDVWITLSHSNEITELLINSRLTHPNGKETNGWDDWSNNQELYLEINS